VISSSAAACFCVISFFFEQGAAPPPAELSLQENPNAEYQHPSVSILFSDYFPLAD
jgi:hypothetical protein